MRNDNGNVFIYILIAIVLLAALNAIVSSSGNDSGSSQRLDKAQRKLLTNEILMHASAAEKAVRDMKATGTDTSFNSPSNDDFYIAKRGDSDYSNRPLHNLLHPKGGGLQHRTVDSYKDSLFTGSTTGWLYQTNTDVGWSPSGTNDIILALSGINKQICETINKRITDSTSIPSASDTAANLFDEESGTNNPLTSSVCSACKGKPVLCIQEDSNGDFVYYNILIIQ